VRIRVVFEQAVHLLLVFATEVELLPGPRDGRSHLLGYFGLEGELLIKLS